MYSVFCAVVCAVLLFTFVNGADDVIERQVCVVGGGAAGSYSAYKLKRRGYTVGVVEPENELGGNCGTHYFDGVPISEAVIIFSDKPFVTSFFDELGVQYTPIHDRVPLETKFVFDAKLGLIMPNPGRNAQQQQDFLDALARYDNLYYTVFGGIGDAPKIPDFATLPAALRTALLTPFGYFIFTNNLGPLVPVLYPLLQGVRAPLPEIPTYYVLRSGGPRLIRDLENNDFLNVIPGCQDIYDRIDNYLGNNNIWLGSKQISYKKKDNGKLIVKFKKPGGDTIKLKCDKLIIGFRPTLEAMSDFSEDEIPTQQANLYAALNQAGFYTSIYQMNHPTLPDIKMSLQHYDIAGGFLIPEWPNVTSVVKQVGGVNAPYVVLSHGRQPEANSVVKSRMTQTLKAIGFTQVSVLDFDPHKYSLAPDVNSAGAGWYGQMDALQGVDNIFYTGSVFSGDGSEFVWEYSQILLDQHFPPLN